MRNIAAISAENAGHALYLTPDMTFYVSEMLSDLFEPIAKALHKKQITTHSYARFASIITDLYHDGEGGLTDQVTACAALAMTFNGLHEWAHTAIQVAVNIHLNTIGAENHSRYPRVVPHELADLRITHYEQIDQRLLWHILVKDPWITYAERSRAQLARMAKVLGPDGRIDTMGEEMIALAKDLPPPDKSIKWISTRETAKRSIKRGYKLHTRLFGPDNLRQLLKFKQLKLSGHRYDYELTIGRGDLFAYTVERNSFTSPIHLTVLRKDSAILCSVCLYFEDAPFIDNLVAITCHLKNPETEIELLQAAQVQSATRWFYADPLLPELKGLRDPTVAPLSFIENVALNAQHDLENIPLRDSFYHYNWSALAQDLMGYPDDLIKIFRQASSHSVWDFIDNTSEAALVMDRAKEFFRTGFANPV